MAAALAGAAAEEAARVVVLANSTEADSVRLARHYAQVRGVPAENIVALPMPAEETVSWRQFVDAVYGPLLDELVKRGWIDAIGSQLSDRMGRRKYAVSRHHISYLVVCRGVPLRVAHEAGLMGEQPAYAPQEQFRTNAGSVDGELALLAMSAHVTEAFVPNPLFRKERPSFLDERAVVKVSRLDGYTYADAAGLAERAVAAERAGPAGRAYVDMGGPHAEGDKWLEEVAKELVRLGYETAVDRERELWPAGAAFEEPAFYFGWHSAEFRGPFAREDFRFPAGAVAVHIHSFSAQSVRSPGVGWCGPLVARGVTATAGNVYEPYLALTVHPHLLLRALGAGRTWGEAACYATPAYSWMGVVIGDPLYRPFAARGGGAGAKK